MLALGPVALALNEKPPCACAEAVAEAVALFRPFPTQTFRPAVLLTLGSRASFAYEPIKPRLLVPTASGTSLARCSADAPAAASDAPSALFPKRWKCVEGCGACCDLTPEDRPDLDKYLSPDELRTYMEMVGEDGWCKHYDREKRSCTVYDTRPAFCRVTLEGMRDRYGVPEHKADKFACSCCKLQIGAVYGYDSEEMARFKEAIGTQAEAAGKGPSRKKPTKKRRG
eukprot:tig00000383_g24694.t1